MKKTIITILITAFAAAVITTAVIFILDKSKISADIASPTMTVIDSSYVVTGKYFLDGDTSGAYLEVTDKTVQLLGTDVKAFLMSVDEKYPCIDTETGKRLVLDGEALAEMTEEYSKAQDYVTVELYAPQTDYRAVTLATSYYSDGVTSNSSGYAYNKDSGTISSLGGARFILGQ